VVGCPWPVAKHSPSLSPFPTLSSAGERIGREKARKIMVKIKTV